MPKTNLDVDFMQKKRRAQPTELANGDIDIPTTVLAENDELQNSYLSEDKRINENDAASHLILRDFISQPGQ
jgi:hypothetical protein